MRVHEIARILGVTSEQVRKDLHRYNVKTSSHMSAVDDTTVKKLFALYDRRKKRKEQKAAQEAELKEQREAEQRKQEKEERTRKERRKKPSPSTASIFSKTSRWGPRPGPTRRFFGAQHIWRPVTSVETPARTATAKGKTAELVLPRIEVMKFTAPPRKTRRKSDSKRVHIKRPKGAPKTAQESTEREQRIRPSFIVKPTKVYTPPPAAKADKKPAEPQVVQIREELTVGEFADKIRIPIAEIIKKLLELGEPRTINQMISSDLCELIAAEYGVEIRIVTSTDESDVEEFLQPDTEKKQRSRPPVVTIMGHVDHGKTTLLDQLRKSNIVAKEFGGITQHIGAYFVATPKGPICFLDTPGHEAFTQMRARGARVTDIVVLLVAADDGVMPQTVEAVNHAKDAGVPIIIAINKIDLPDADLEKVRRQLMQHGLVSEALGGDTLMAEISAKKAQGIDHLMEVILLQAEMMEQRANPDRAAIGRIIEAHLDPRRGPVATILVQDGTLHQGDNFVSGTRCGRVRTMRNDFGVQVNQALPSFPVEIIGFEEVPEVGELFVAVPDERTARRIVEARLRRRKLRQRFQPDTPQVSLESLQELISEGKIKEIKLILRADVQGSLEAVGQSLQKLSTDEVKIHIIHGGVGPITVSDVDLAAASGAIVVGFNVRPDTPAQEAAEKQSVEVKLYRIIYDLLDDFKKGIIGMLEPERREVPQGKAEVKKIFKISSVGSIAGCLVLEGNIGANHRARLVRDGTVVYEGSIDSLKRVKDDVSRVESGQECGIHLTNFNDVKEGDVIESYIVEEIQPEIES